MHLLSAEEYNFTESCGYFEVGGCVWKGPWFTGCLANAPKRAARSERASEVKITDLGRTL